MNPETIQANGHRIALIREKDILLTDDQSALDFMSSVDYLTDAQRIVLPLTCLPEAFFDLSSRIAGGILQKFVNYRFKIAIWGDFSVFHSKPLRAFMDESNRGRDIFFCPDEEAAVRALSRDV